MQLPKRSMWMMAPLTVPSAARVGAASGRRTKSSTEGPSASGSTPRERAPATGAKMSRPWKVVLTGSRKNCVLVESKDFGVADALVDVAEHAVVGADEEVAAPARDDRAARRADAGIDDRDVHRPRRERLERRAQGERARLHVVRGHLVRDVYDLCSRVDGEDGALHRADEVIDGAEIGQESDDHKEQWSVAGGQWSVKAHLVFH